MILMIAMAFQAAENPQKVLIVVPNALIKDQFVGYFECQVLPDGIEITEDTLFEDRYDYDVLLVDEGDVIVRDWCLVFEQLKGGLYKPRGLYSMKAKPFIMFTATFSTGEKAIMMKALQCHKPDHWLKFETWNAAIKGDKCADVLEFHETTTEKAGHDKLLKLAKDACKEQPVLVFYEEKTEALRKVCEAACKPNLPLREINDANGLAQAKIGSADVENGIILLTQVLCRGIDLKLKKDALVIICVNGAQTMSYTMATQMNGRGNRAQGTQKG